MLEYTLQNMTMIKDLKKFIRENTALGSGKTDASIINYVLIIDHGELFEKNKEYTLSEVYVKLLEHNKLGNDNNFREAFVMGAMEYTAEYNKIVKQYIADNNLSKILDAVVYNRMEINLSKELGVLLSTFYSHNLKNLYTTSTEKTLSYDEIKRGFTIGTITIPFDVKINGIQCTIPMEFFTDNAYRGDRITKEYFSQLTDKELFLLCNNNLKKVIQSKTFYKFIRPQNSHSI